MIYLLLAVLMANACTNARWMVSDLEAVDSEESERVERQFFLKASQVPDPESPVLRLELHSRNHYEYPKKIEIERTLQEYRPSTGYLLGGVLGAGLGAYLAYGERFSRGRTPARTVAFTAAGSLAALVGILNMKPVGEPRPTGERELIDRTGSVVKIDTTRHPGANGERSADLNVTRGAEQIYSEEGRILTDGVLEIGLDDLLSNMNIRGANPGHMGVEIQFNDSLYTYRFPVEQVLRPYARVVAPVTELRSTPGDRPDNVLAELVEGSRLLISSADSTEGWYRVLYGLSESYVAQSDAEIIWDIDREESRQGTVSVPQVPFGEVDVESNIPILTQRESRNRALVVTNERYSAPYTSRAYTHRDGRLIRSYLENALGHYTYATSQLRDVTNPGELMDRIGQIRESASDSTRLFLYLGGHARVTSGDSIRISYLLSRPEQQQVPSASIPLETIFHEIARIPASRRIVVMDLSFHTADGQPVPEERLDLEQPLRRESRDLRERGGDTALFVSSGLNQDSNLYLGETEDKKHHIFTYYFARALQERNVTAGDIQQFLERNVSYTSRRLHDRPQEPRLIGNSVISLTDGE